ncbi:sulfite exporter TauE/SafE family protein [Breoghania sp. L-A4]|nr:sulfite exporter TauE/SafE family protein [Breoghania sp. L-A4]
MDTLIFLAAAVFVLAGTIKGTVGIGLPTAAVGILAQFIDPHLALALVVFPIMTGNAWQAYRAGGMLATLKRYWIFALVSMVALWLSTFVTAAISTDTLITVLGGVIVIFAVTSLAFTPPVIPDRFDRLAQIIAGVLAGIMGGFTAIWAPPMVIYFIARRVDKDEFVRASGLLIFLGSLPLCLGFWQSGLLTGPNALISLMMIVPTLLGFTFGEILRRRLNDNRFRTAVLLIFLAMGLNLIRKALF